MDQKIAHDNETGKECSQAAQQLAFAAENIKTAADFARFMTGVMAALLTRKIDASTASAICGTANTMLKAIEMQVKYGALRQGKRELYLTEANDEDNPQAPRPAKLETATQKSDITPVRAKKPAWCADCYVSRKQYTSATEEMDDEPLCLSCANQRRKLLEEDLDEDL